MSMPRFAAERALAAQIEGAQAQLEIAEINLGYTEIRAPIDGRISSTAVTEGNVVSPTSGTLAKIVSQDPMYVLFPVALRTGLDLRSRYAPEGRLQRGRAQAAPARRPDLRTGWASSTMCRRLSPRTPTRSPCAASSLTRCFPARRRAPAEHRELVDGEFVTVMLEGVQPITVLAIPRAAVLSDQQGDYVYVVDAQNKAQLRRIQLGQSTPSTAVMINGLKEGELVISEGLQRVRPGETVSPGPASPPPAIAPAGEPAAAAGNTRRGWRKTMISAIFVDRPRLAVVIALVITIAGVLALMRIPVAQLPDIVPPQVQVTATYPGASAAVVEASIAPADRGAGRRRRQDDLHEIDERQ